MRSRSFSCSEYGLSYSCWNGSLNSAVADLVPFGDYRQSGNGREWGIYGLEEFTEVKAVMGYAAS